MRALIQRVKSSDVSIDGRVVGRIGRGLLVFLAIHVDDTEDKVEKMANKLLNLRIFEDEQGKYNISLKDAGKEVLLVSQFTLYGNCEKGNRPSFIKSARPEKAEPYYNELIKTLREKGAQVETGEFGGMMEVNISNDGPTSLILDI